MGNITDAQTVKAMLLQCGVVSSRKAHKGENKCISNGTPFEEEIYWYGLYSGYLFALNNGIYLQGYGRKIVDNRIYEGQNQGYDRYMRDSEGQNPTGYERVIGNGKMREYNDDGYSKNVEESWFSVAEKAGNNSWTGKKLFDDGQTYFGQMDYYGTPDGQGKMISADGAVQEGQWRNGEFQE